MTRSEYVNSATNTALMNYDIEKRVPYNTALENLIKRFSEIAQNAVAIPSESKVGERGER